MNLETLQKMSNKHLDQKKPVNSLVLIRLLSKDSKNNNHACKIQDQIAKGFWFLKRAKFAHLSI